MSHSTTRKPQYTDCSSLYPLYHTRGCAYCQCLRLAHGVINPWPSLRMTSGSLVARLRTHFTSRRAFSSTSGSELTDVFNKNRTTSGALTQSDLEKTIRPLITLTIALPAVPRTGAGRQEICA